MHTRVGARTTQAQLRTLSEMRRVRAERSGTMLSAKESDARVRKAVASTRRDLERATRKGAEAGRRMESGAALLRGRVDARLGV